jgi:hypothetical protein
MRADWNRRVGSAGGGCATGWSRAAGRHDPSGSELRVVRQFSLSHAYAAFTVDSKAAPNFSSSALVAGSSSFSRPISSSGIRLLRTAAMTRLISAAACAGVCSRTDADAQLPRERVVVALVRGLTRQRRYSEARSSRKSSSAPLPSPEQIWVPEVDNPTIQVQTFYSGASPIACRTARRPAAVPSYRADQREVSTAER